MKERRKGPEEVARDEGEALFIESVSLLGVRPSQERMDRAARARGRGGADNLPTIVSDDALFEAAISGELPARSQGESTRSGERAAPETPAPVTVRAVEVEVDLDDVSLEAMLRQGPHAPTPSECETDAPSVTLSLTRAVTPKELRRMVDRGRMHISDRLDLHGAVATEARDRTLSFIREARRGGARCVIIIHGRGLHSNGLPVLRGLVQDLLRDELADDVLQMATAPKSEGGEGATLVLLRR